MSKFIDVNNDNSIIDFNNMTFKQFRYLVGQAIRKNNEEKNEREIKYFNENYNGFEVD